MTTPDGPLSGYRILDLTAFISGPFGSQHLGDLGADIIKIETPRGDETREKGYGRNPKMGPVFMNLNRNKRSVALNLKAPDDQDTFRRLVKSSDAVLHNMRPEAMARLGAGYDDLTALRPDLIYCQIVGYGSSGPYAGKPAFEDVVQGVSGYAALQGAATGTPTYAAFAMVDCIAGLVAAKSLIAALLHRERTGEGQLVEVPMLETAIAFTMPSNMWERTFTDDGRVGYPRYFTPSRKPFKTRDGYFCTVFGSDKHFALFFAAAGRSEVLEDPRFSTNNARSLNSDALWGVIGDIFSDRSTAEWVDIFAEADLPGMPMNTIEDLFEDPHLRAVEFFRHFDHPSEGAIRLIDTPVHFSKSPAAIRRLPPRHGEHTEEVLRDLPDEADD